MESQSDSASAQNERSQQQHLPNFLQSVNVKYVKLGYHYLVSNGLYLLLVPLIAAASMHLSSLTSEDFLLLWDKLRFNLVAVVLSSTLIVSLSTIYFMKRPRPVYLLDFACYKPDGPCKRPRERFMEQSTRAASFTEENPAFQKKILERSELGQSTYFPEALLSSPPNPCMAEARKEAETVMIGAIDGLLQKTGVKPKDIGILTVNYSLFDPAPSLSAMVVNHYKLREKASSPLPRPHAQQAHAASAPRPYAQPTRCLGPSASYAATRCSQYAASAPRPHAKQAARCLGPMRSQHAASAPRPHAQQHVASAPRPHA